MMTCKDLYWHYVKGYNNLFNTTWVDITMCIISQNMILDGLY